MLKKHDFAVLYEKFIQASKTGKRLSRNGKKITEGTIRNYENSWKLLQNFSIQEDFELNVLELKGTNRREFNAARRYYNTFYKKLCNHLTRRNSLNNYTGQNIKILRTFFNWLNIEHGLQTGSFHKQFYVLKEDIPIITLSMEQMQYLIHDQDFRQKLSPPLQRAKDVFVFGCSTGLRISDLRNLKPHEIFNRDGITYLGNTSKKTSAGTVVRLAPHCVAIANRYRKKNAKRLLPVAINSVFNLRAREICELAGWTWTVSKIRSVGNKPTEQKKANKPYRFCDLVSSHTMRRTCITTMLAAGMPEYIVRKISGHTSNSRSFFRYVELAQKLMDDEINKLFTRLENPAIKNL